MTERKGPGRPKAAPAQTNIPEGIPPGHEITLREEAVVKAHDQAVEHYTPALVGAGRIQAMTVISAAATLSAVSGFEAIRKSNGFMGLPYVDGAGKPRRVGSLDEYCRVFIGASYNALSEHAQNLRALGPDAFRAALELKVPARQLRDIRGLAAEAQDAVKSALEAKDKAAAIEVLQEFSARAVERDEENHADLAAARERAKKLTEEKDELSDQLHNLGRYKEVRQFILEKGQMGMAMYASANNVFAKLLKLGEAIETQDLSKFEEGENVRTYVAETYYITLLRVKVAIDDVVGRMFDTFGHRFRNPQHIDERFPIEEAVRQFLDDVDAVARQANAWLRVTSPDDDDK